MKIVDTSQKPEFVITPEKVKYRFWDWGFSTPFSDIVDRVWVETHDGHYYKMLDYKLSDLTLVYN